MLSFLGVAPLAKVQLAGPVDGLAAFYLLAQVIERVIEPFTDLKVLVRFDSLRSRAIFFAGVAGGIGCVACYLTTGIFSVVGVTFTWNSRLVDAVLSGLLLTGGTKVVHDLISLIASAGSGGD